MRNIHLYMPKAMNLWVQMLRNNQGVVTRAFTFHSTSPDILIEYLLGFRADHENRFTLEPLLPAGKWDYFYLANIRYRHHDIDIVWKKDWDDRKAGDQGMLRVWVDGKLAAESEDLNGKITVAIE